VASSSRVSGQNCVLPTENAVVARPGGRWSESAARGRDRERALVVGSSAGNMARRRMAWDDSRTWRNEKCKGCAALLALGSHSHHGFVSRTPPRAELSVLRDAELPGAAAAARKDNACFRLPVVCVKQPRRLTMSPPKRLTTPRIGWWTGMHRDTPHPAHRISIGNVTCPGARSSRPSASRLLS